MQVQSCCCGCSLKKGSTIILSLSALGGILSIMVMKKSKMTSFTQLAVHIFFGITCFACIIALHGVAKNKRKEVLFGLFAHVAYLILIPIWFLMVFFAIDVMAGKLKDDEQGLQRLKEAGFYTDKTNKEEAVKSGMNTVKFFVLAIFLIMEGLIFYFTVVLYSYYKTLVEFNESLIVYNATSQQPPLGCSHPGPPQPGYQQPGQPQPGYQQPGQPQPGYQQPRQPQPGYQQPRQPQSGYQQPGQPQSGYQQPGQPLSGYSQQGQQPGQPQPGYQQPGQPRSGYPQPGQAQSGYPQSGQQCREYPPNDRNNPVYYPRTMFKS